MSTIDADSHKKTARIEARVSQELKDLIERAANCSNQSVSEFMLKQVEPAARKVVEAHDRLQLDQEQSRQLVDILLAPPKPNSRLKKSIAQYRKNVESR